MKKILLLVAALTFCFTCYCQESSKIDAELQNEIQLRNDDELIKINIIMKAQYDQFDLRSKAEIYRKRADKRAFVINALKHFAQETQQEVMSYLNYFSERKSVNDITQFWIYNGISCSATKDVIAQLAFLDDVLIIGFDKEQNLLPEYETSTPDKGINEITYNVTKVNANLVWALGYTGEGIIVAVLDTGVNYNHSDLTTHMWNDTNYPNHGYNFVDNNNNPMDDHSHGTHCAGTVAGNGAAGSQTGMAPNAQIMAVKVLNGQGQGSLQQAISGIQFAITHGADVLSMSWGWSGGGEAAVRIPLRNAMINVLEAGVVAAVAAGNDGSFPGNWQYPIPNNVGCPGNCPPPWLHPDQTTTGGISAVVCVGATNSNDQIANFSSRGPVTWQAISGFNDYPYNPGMGLIRPDVCAPGVGIKSCTHNSNSGYTSMDGTSMATPCVAGVMALMLSKNPDLTPAEICEILETTAVHLPTATSPKGSTYGSGRINALAAVNVVSACSTIKNLTYTLSYDKTVNLSWSKPVNNTNLIGYNVYKDSTLLISSHQSEAFAIQVAEEGNYLFCVSAVHEIDGECESALVCATVPVVSICEPITDLVSSVDGFQVNLSWRAPEPTSEILHYNIYRDEQFVTSVQTENFNEEVAAGNYTYSVNTQYRNDCISDKVSVNVVVLKAPINLTATANTQTMSIELLWEYENVPVLFNVYRDNVKIASNITEKQYSDSNVDAGCIDYCYYVKALADEIESAASNVDCAGFVGIEEFSNHLKVYPNPSNTIVNIEDENINKISVINSIGQIVKVVLVTDHHTSIDVSKLSAGNYLFCISYLDNSSKNVRVVIK